MNAASWLPCPFCATPIKKAATEEQFQHAGSTHWGTIIFTACGCFQERWTYGDYGTKDAIEKKARRIWNNRPTP